MWHILSLNFVRSYDLWPVDLKTAPPDMYAIIGMETCTACLNLLWLSIIELIQDCVDYIVHNVQLQYEYLKNNIIYANNALDCHVTIVNGNDSDSDHGDVMKNKMWRPNGWHCIG